MNKKQFLQNLRVSGILEGVQFLVSLFIVRTPDGIELTGKIRPVIQKPNCPFRASINDQGTILVEGAKDLRDPVFWGTYTTKIQKLFGVLAKDSFVLSMDEGQEIEIPMKMKAT